VVVALLCRRAKVAEGEPFAHPFFARRGLACGLPQEVRAVCSLAPFNHRNGGAA
jgi:hypothetical protein